MNTPDQDDELALKRIAHGIWDSEGRPDGRAAQHWAQAKKQLVADRGVDPMLKEAERVIDGNPAVDFQALATKDVKGG